jgi:retinol dehydrogenase-12
MHPGMLKTDLARHVSRMVGTVLGWVSWDPIYGAYTELYAGFSKDISMENSGCWGRPLSLPHASCTDCLISA